MGIFFKFGFFFGGIRIIICGCNLGKLKEDVIFIGVSGCDFLLIFEYYSLVKLVVCIKFWIGFGFIVLEIKFGG